MKSGVNTEILQAALQQLNQAIINHGAWHRSIIRTIVCRLPYDDRDVEEDAHRKCHFGQWYYSDGLASTLCDHPAFIALEAKHRNMHQHARHLLLVSMDTPTISADDYDNFAQTLDLLQLELHTLKYELEDWFHGHDLLTGTGNRASMLARLRETLELGKRNIGPNCISIMDIDHFKNVNDTHGHLVGDRVLAASAHYVMESLRTYDKMFRYGGEEFLILMPNTGLQESVAVIERIRKGIAASTLAHDDSTPIAITMSFGIALLDPEISVEESMERADKAMYASKNSGRNRVTVWESPTVDGPG